MEHIHSGMNNTYTHLSKNGHRCCVARTNIPGPSQLILVVSKVFTLKDKSIFYRICDEIKMFSQTILGSIIYISSLIITVSIADLFLVATSRL